MRRIVLLSIFGVLIGCSTTSKIDWSNSFWGVLESEEAYLYTSDSLTSIVEKEVKKGTILFFHIANGDFHEVYTRNPRKVDKELRRKFRYYLYKPKYSKLSYKYTNDYASVYEIPFDPNQNYFIGERGGCYYINKNGNKTYVSRSFCENNKKEAPVIINPSPIYKSVPNSNCPTVQCSGKTQKGIRCKNKTSNCSGRCHLH